MRRDEVFESTLRHERVDKVWGHEEIMLNHERYCLKRLVLVPGFRCSLHHHEIKHETFIVEQGRLHVMLQNIGGDGGKEYMTLHPGQRLVIKPRTQHLFWSHVPTSFLEVSTFDTPDDSVRADSSCHVDDDFKRSWPAWPGHYNILVIGDTMIDEYVECDLPARSQEAPIFIATRRGEERVLGGSANVVAALAGAGAKVDYVSVVGRDEVGEEAQRLLESLGEGCIKYVASDLEYRTTLKRRYVAEGRQLFRYDDEEIVRAELATTLVHQAEAMMAVKKYDAIVVPNYRKGVVTQGMYEAMERRVDPKETLVFIDPFIDSSILGSKVFLVKGNRVEVERYLNSTHPPRDEDLTRAMDFHVKTKAKHAVVTNAGSGAAMHDGIFLSQHTPRRSGEVVDVTGAGDVMLTSLVLETLGRQAFGLEPTPRDELSLVTEAPDSDAHAIESSMRHPMAEVLELAVEDASLAVRHRRIRSIL